MSLFSKIRRLLTASLATLRGNVPFTTAFMLQLFAYMHGTEVSAAPSAAANASMQPKVAIKGAKAGGGGGKPLLDTNDVTSEGVRKKVTSHNNNYSTINYLEFPLIHFRRQ
jgi:hypothetical protein